MELKGRKAETRSAERFGPESVQIWATTQQLCSSLGTLWLFHPHFPSNYTHWELLRSSKKTLQPCGHLLEATAAPAALWSRGQRRTDGVDQTKSTATTQIWPRRHNGTNCSNCGAQWPLLVQQANDVTGLGGQCSCLNTGYRLIHTPLRLREPSPPKTHRRSRRKSGELSCFPENEERLK